MFFHGGGFVVGGLDSHDLPCRLLCKHAGVHVLSVEYRKAPEFPLPAAYDDGEAAFAWAVEHARELGADPERIGVGGDSAGATTSAVVAGRAARAGVRGPDFQLLLYPGADRGQGPRRRSRELFAEGFFLTDAQINWFEDHFTAPGDDGSRCSTRTSADRARSTSSAPGSIRCATRARPTARRCARRATRSRCGASRARSTASSTSRA